MSEKDLFLCLTNLFKRSLKLKVSNKFSPGDLINLTFMSKSGYGGPENTVTL